MVGKSRRRILQTATVCVLFPLAGCSGTRSDDSPNGGDDTDTSSPDSERPSASNTGTDTAGGTPSPRQTAKLAAGDGAEADHFGNAVALASDVALVGARFEDAPDASDAGSAYVFERDGSGWSQAAKLVATQSRDEQDFFGGSVALSRPGDVALVGAFYDDDPDGFDGGSAFVFERAGGSWNPVTKLAAHDDDPGDNFGTSVALDEAGETALIGAPGDEDPNGSDAGSAYVFERDGGDWTRVAKIAAADGDEDDSFGVSVALSDAGDVALVGANTEESPNGEFSGAAYVFERSGGAWSQTAKLVAEDGDDDDLFGRTVALSGAGDAAIVGAHNDTPNGRDSGAAYVFERSGGGWSQAEKLVPDDNEKFDQFGWSVALAGDLALVGAKEEDAQGSASGAAHLFQRAGGAWQQVTTLTAEDGNAGDMFGAAVAMTRETALIGADGDDDPNGNGAGSAYVFEL